MIAQVNSIIKRQPASEIRRGDLSCDWCRFRLEELMDRTKRENWRASWQFNLARKLKELKLF